jgi:phosphonate transport system substrate-binding protein
MKNCFHVLLLGLILVVAACGSNEADAGVNGNEAQESNGEQNSANVEDNDNGADTDGEAAQDREGWPEKFVYGILPSEDTEVLSTRYEPLEEYLAEELGVEVEFFQATDYNAVIEAMRNEHIHASHFGPFSYILAHDRSNAEAFAMGVESEDDATYNSVIVTLEDSGIESLEDLEGSDFAWVDAASTSGHLFPKAHLVNELDLTVDEVDAMFGNTVFAGGHDTALLALLNGDVDAAGIGDFIIDRLADTHGEHENLEQLKILATTDDIPRGPDAIHADLPESFKQAVADAFHTMHEEPALEQFMEEFNYQGGFLPVEDAEYDIIRQTADALEMSPDELME